MLERMWRKYAIGGNVNWYSHYGEEYGSSSKTKIKQPYDPAISLLAIYLEKNMVKGYMHINVHRSTVFYSQDMETI